VSVDTPAQWAPLVAALRADAPIAVLEASERELKDLLARELAAPLDGGRIRALAALQQEIGFLLKYKSYAVKAASPLGYSVFLQRPGEGFSFQQHVTHKTEIFYILDVLPGGFVFLCDLADWQAIYDRESFLAWMNGAPDARYEQFRFVPEPGDVVVIDKLSVVHSVVGCVLAEFATREQIPAHPIEGGHQTTLGTDQRFDATLFRFDPSGRSAMMSHRDRAISLHIASGSGQLLLGTAAEMSRPSPPSMAARTGDLFLIAAGAQYAFVNDSAAPLLVAEHRIEPAVAFI
jgi:mannose-6-phosphate isomerase-like protein (cupin superfamily)